MKVPAPSVDITVAITSNLDLAVRTKPHPMTRVQPGCEYVEIPDIPSDVSSYIDQSERKDRNGK